MSILYFNSQQSCRIHTDSGNSPLYLDCIESTYARFETFISVSQLIVRLRKSHHDIIGAVLIISSISELIDLIQNQELLEDIPIILILPVDNPEMNSLGHALSPRYVTSVDHSDMETRQVLVQFIQKLKEQFRNESYRWANQTNGQE
jgi:hypothetical protein